MNIPKQFLIKGKLWKVEYKWGLHDHEVCAGFCDGLCDFDLKTIFIRREVPVEQKFGIFMHELIHATLHECHLHENGGVDGILEEVLCEGITDVITSLFTLRFKRVRSK